MVFFYNAPNRSLLGVRYKYYVFTRQNITNSFSGIQTKRQTASGDIEQNSWRKSRQVCWISEGGIMRKVFLKASNSQNLPSSTSTLTVGKIYVRHGRWVVMSLLSTEVNRHCWLNFTKVHPLWHHGGKTTDSDLWDPNKRRRCTFPPLSATYCHPSQNVKKIKKYQSPSPQIFTQTRKVPNQILIQNHLTQGQMGRRIR